MRRNHNFAALLAITFAVILVAPIQVAAWHFQVVSTGGVLFSGPYTQDYIELPFQLGFVTVTSGTGTAHTFFELEGANCNFIATASASYPFNSLAGAAPEFSVVIIADPGDASEAFLDLVWASSASGVFDEVHMSAAVSAVGAGLRFETVPIQFVDMSVYSDEETTASEALHIGPLSSGTIVSYLSLMNDPNHYPGTYANAAGLSIFGPPYAPASGSATNSISMVLCDGETVGVDPMTWGELKALYR